MTSKIQKAKGLAFDGTIKLKEHFQIDDQADYDLELDSVVFELKTQHTIDLFEIELRVSDWPVTFSTELEDGGFSDAIHIQQAFVTRLGQNQAKRGPRAAGIFNFMLEVTRRSGHHVKLTASDVYVDRGNTKMTVRAVSFGLRLTEVVAAQTA